MTDAETSGRERDLAPKARGPLRYVFLALGFGFVGLGAVGVVVPGLPTTPFMLLAAWMFSKSSPRFHAWLRHHRVFGRYVRDWEHHRVIPLYAKVLSSSVMTVGMIMMVARGAPLWATVAAILVCAYGAVFIWRCPSRPPAPGPRDRLAEPT